MEAVGTCRLVLNTCFVLNLEQTFYIPSFCRNLISISRLVLLGFLVSFSKTGFELIKDSNIVGISTIDNSFFKIHLRHNFNLKTLQDNVGIK